MIAASLPLSRERQIRSGGIYELALQFAKAYDSGDIAAAHRVGRGIIHTIETLHRGPWDET
jgi:hypothetical protein